MAPFLLVHARMKRGRQIRVGISGWTYDGWRGAFYPEGLAHRKELEYSSRQLNSIEINGTFYSLQRPPSYQSWFDETPDDFIFSVKGGRYITHIRRLIDIEQPIRNFFASGILLLKQKLGPILWQFPPNMPFDQARFESFFEMLPRDTKQAATLARHHDSWLNGRTYTETDERRPLRYAVEIRHPSFDNPKFLKLLRRNKIALVLADSAGRYPMLEEVTSDLIYSRLHGAEELYASGYNDRAIKHWAQKLQKLAGKTRDIFVYFDNDVKVMAPFDAVALLKRLVKGYEPATPMLRVPASTHRPARAA